MDDLYNNPNNKKHGYVFIDDGKTIVFIFDSPTYGIEKAKNVYVEGSFNGWKKKAQEWELSTENGNLFILKLPAKNVMVPGNSGCPEFKFYVLYDIKDEEKSTTDEISYKTEEKELTLENGIPGYQMATNNLILLPTDDPNYIIENSKIADKVKELKDFNLENPEDVATISNFRLVPGTKKLFRGYHPYKMSHREYDTEKTRITLVNKQLKDNGVKSIITLSGDETLKDDEEMSDYVSEIRSAGNQLCANTSYNTVYFNSTSKELGELIGQIIKFIDSHPGPYYVHCRIGTDRTGFVSATLAALCGAAWNEIATDYQKTNNIGIREFRDYKILQYSFEQILSHPISEVKNLQQELTDYYIGKKFVDTSDIEKLKTNLN